MSKKNRRNSKQQRQSSAHQSPWIWLALGAAAIVVLAVLAVTQPWTVDEPQVTPEVAGAPRLAVDETVIDEGYVKYNVPIRTTFRLTNVGDQPLKIQGNPQVWLVEGC